MIRTALGVWSPVVDDSGMATNTLNGNQHNVVRVPRSTDNGLWNALASRVTESSTGGSSLVVLDVLAIRGRVAPAVRPAA